MDTLKPGLPGKPEQLYIIKIGGNVIDDEDALRVLLHDFAAIEGKKIMVHGGGKIATEMGDKLGIRSKYVNGRRVTDEATIDLVTMVYGGLINKKIVAGLQGLGCNALGLTGADANLIPAIQRPVKEVDFGYVGDVDPEKIGSESVRGLLDNHFVPDFAPLTHDGRGRMLNTNADTIAASLGIALSSFYKVRLIYLFDKKGVLRDVHDDQQVVSFMDEEIYQQLLKDKALADGILPKLENAFDAIRQGVSEVLIGRASDLPQNLGDQVSGTLIR